MWARSRERDDPFRPLLLMSSRNPVRFREAPQPDVSVRLRVSRYPTLGMEPARFESREVRRPLLLGYRCRTPGGTCLEPCWLEKGDLPPAVERGQAYGFARGRIESAMCLQVGCSLGGTAYDFSPDLSTIVYGHPGGHADRYFSSAKYVL